MTATGGVYVIQSPSGKYRVGLTNDFASRFRLYKKDAFNPKRKHYNSYFSRAIRKYGWTAMRIGTLQLPAEARSETERLFIWLLKSNYKDFGYNRTSGGESGFTANDETCALAAANSKRNYKSTATALNKGRDTFFQNFSDADRAVWRSAKLGVPKTFSEQGLRNMKECHSTESARANMRTAQRALALKRAKRVIFNNEIVLLSDVARALNITNAGAHAMLKRGKLQLAPTSITEM